MERFFTTTEVAAQNGCCRQAAIIWAKKNGVALHGNSYLWTANDITRFKDRPKPGRRWDQK